METDRPPYDTGKVSMVRTRISHLFYDFIDSQRMLSFFTTSRARTRKNFHLLLNNKKYVCVFSSRRPGTNLRERVIDGGVEEG